MAKTKTFPEHYQSADPAVAVLKRVDCLKSLVKINNFFKSRAFYAVIFLQQRLNFFVDIFRLNSVITTYFIWQFLIFSNPKPFFTLI